jgi:prepilin-type N-terminal cleavage/methylation domain-containing protein
MTKRSLQGFSLSELMITVTVLGIVGSLAFSSSQQYLRRDRANAAAAELVGWLETTSARAAAYGPCQVQFSTGSGLAGGAPFATLAAGDARCTPQGNLTLPSIGRNDTYNLGVTYTNAATSITFTARGGVVANNEEAIVRISVNGQPPLRCVRASFGSLSIGVQNTTGNVAQACTVWEST